MATREHDQGQAIHDWGNQEHPQTQLRGATFAHCWLLLSSPTAGAGRRRTTRHTERKRVNCDWGNAGIKSKTIASKDIDEMCYGGREVAHEFLLRKTPTVTWT